MRVFLTSACTNQILDPTHGLRASKNVDLRTASRARHHRCNRRYAAVVTPLLETDQPIAHFEGRADNPEADFTWWVYSLGVYREIFRILGFAIEEVTA
jgi:hypothetical protein